MNKEINQVVQMLKAELGLYLMVSFGIFLFILFFQPFQIERFDYNNRLIFNAGLAGIIFLSMLLIRLTFYKLIRGEDDEYEIIPTYLGGFFIIVISSIASVFYLKFVGKIPMTFYASAKAVLICMSAPIILRVEMAIRNLRKQNQSLINEKESMRLALVELDKDSFNKELELMSENNAERLKFVVADVVFLKSADNYVEIAFWEDDTLKKKLIRNTLKNMESQLKLHSNFIRCHRTSIVNIRCIEKLHRNYNNHFLSLKESGEQLPVSRQYLLKIKEVLNS